MLKICKNCSHCFEDNSRHGRLQHCSKDCRYSSRKTSKKFFRPCDNCQQMYLAYEYKIVKGYGNFCSKVCSNSGKFNPMTSRVGLLNPNWKGGVTSVKRGLGSHPKYKQWRKTILERDDYTCQCCSVRGGYLEVHHKKSTSRIFSDNQITTIEEAVNCSELWDLNNGQTLCLDCHKKTDNYFFKERGIRNGAQSIQTR